MCSHSRDMLNLHIHKAFVHFQVPSTLKLVEYSFINLWLPFCYRLHESLFCQLPPECSPYHLNVQHTVIIVGTASERVNKYYLFWGQRSRSAQDIVPNPSPSWRVWNFKVNLIKLSSLSSEGILYGLKDKRQRKPNATLWSTTESREGS